MLTLVIFRSKILVSLSPIRHTSDTSTVNTILILIHNTYLHLCTGSDIHEQQDKLLLLFINLENLRRNELSV